MFSRVQKNRGNTVKSLFIAPLLFIGIFALPVRAEIKIGVAGPMTGGSAAFGEQIQNGAKIAIDEINRQGGLLGQKLVLVAEDDACDPKQARNVANKMAAEKAVVVLGHWCAVASMAATSVYNEEGILQIDPGALLEKLTQQGMQTYFRVSTTSKSFAQAIGRYIVEHNPNAKIAIVTDQVAVTTELTEELQSFFGPTANTVVAVEEIRAGDKDFSSTIDGLKTKRPHVVICACFSLEAGLLARQMADKKLNVYYYGWDTFNSLDFLNIIAGIDTGKIMSIDYARPPASESLKKLETELRAMQLPTETTSVLTYAAMQIFADAVRTTNSLETARIARVMHDKTFDTVIGPVSFDAFGDRRNPRFATYQWIDRRLKEIGPVF